MLPKPGDCVTLRIDPVASGAHIKSRKLAAALGGLPAQTYLAIVGEVSIYRLLPLLLFVLPAEVDLMTTAQSLEEMSAAKPWRTHIVHLIAKPPTRGGPLVDFAPRIAIGVRFRPRRTARTPLLAVAPPLAAALRAHGTRALEDFDADVLSYGDITNSRHWGKMHYTHPETGKLTPVVSSERVVFEFELDIHPVVDFGYDWAAPCANPLQFFREADELAK